MKDNHSEHKYSHNFPPLDIIDLDKVPSEAGDNNTSDKNGAKDSHSSANNDNEASGFFDKVLRINWHIVLLLVVLLSVIFIVYRFATWGNRVESNFDPNNTNTELELEVLDNILPMLYTGEAPAADDGVRTVVAFGNAPFADDLGSDDNLATLIGELTDAVIYNCAVEGSYLAASEPTYSAENDPMDAFNFFWMTTLAAMKNTVIYESAFEALGDNVPAGAKEAYDTLSTLDFSSVDVVTVMYDASDYLDGRKISNPENNTDIQTFYGNLNAGIEKIHEYYPHIRIIVMSPTYAYAVNDKGEYVSSDLYLYDEYPLSTYAMMLERGATMHASSFLDNFYGTVNELNADQYLTDHLHLNVEGRKKVAERFVYALEYYDE